MEGPTRAGLVALRAGRAAPSSGCSQEALLWVKRRVWGKETRSRTVSGLVVWIWCRLFPDQMPDPWPKAHLAPTAGPSARSRSMRRGPSIAERSGGYRGAVSSARSVTWRSPPQECTRPRVHSGALGCGGIVMDRFVGLGRARVLAHRPGPRREVLRAVLLGRSTGGEEAVRLQSSELGRRRPDPAWRRAESACSKHRGDGRGRDIDPEFQELPADPEVAPPGVLLPQPKDQVPDRGIEPRTTGRPRATPASSLQEVPVPSRQGVRPTRKPFHRCRDRTRAAAARNARSAVVKRTRLPPRRRTLSW